MLLQEVQKSQQNCCQYAKNTNFFGQYLSSIHYQPIYQLPEGV